MNFFKKIFTNKSSNDSKGNSSLSILENAISDIGWWTWWTTDFPNLIQIEFGGTQLYFDEKDNSKAPNNFIAIQFINPKSVSFLTHKEYQTNTNENWFDLLQNDKLELPSCDYENFTFLDENLMKSIIDEADKINTIYGYSPKEKKFYKEKYKLVFWAGYFGFSVNADEMKILTHNGEIKLDDISDVNTKWWEYWKEYWSLKDTENSLPLDNICEVTIPVDKFKFQK